MFLSPLYQIYLAISNKNMQHIDLYINCAILLSSGTWITYGIFLGKDYNIIIPNVIGLFVSLLQMSTWIKLKVQEETYEQISSSDDRDDGIHVSNKSSGDDDRDDNKVIDDCELNYKRNLVKIDTMSAIINNESAKTTSNSNGNNKSNVSKNHKTNYLDLEDEILSDDYEDDNASYHSKSSNKYKDLIIN